MKKQLLSFLLMLFAGLVSAQDLKPDVYETSKGKLTIHFIGHGTLMFDFNGVVVHVDPWGSLSDYSKQPKANIILITHAHPDHLDSASIALIRKPETKLIVNQESFVKLGKGIVMRNGESKVVDGVNIEAVPAYNTTAGRDIYHSKGVGNGYILTFGNVRVYVAGDTEVIPEMALFKKVDIAFLPVNQPYTMTTDQFVRAVELLRPKVVYPYHYSETSMDELTLKMKPIPGIKLIIRAMK
jgi:L-ascorbate metabolism protein UlaG (beta-lactamase superfamily)